MDPASERHTLPFGARSRPGADWTSRVLVLLVGLLAIKLALLVESREHLFQMHFRVGSKAVEWADWISFGIFLGLVLANGFVFANRCRETGVRAVRAGSGVFLVLGLALLFLNFHEGDKNYLHPIMAGVLDWSDLLPYLQLNLFYRPPYLAVWLMLMAAGAYVLIRTRNGTLLLHWMTVLAVAYALIHLREWAQLGTELMVVDAVGIATLVAAWRPGSRIRPIWFLLPAAWTALAWLLFLPESERLSDPAPYFSLLLGGTLSLFGGAACFAWRFGFYKSWVTFGLFFGLAFFMLCNRHYPGAENYQKMLVYGLTLPVYAVGEFLLVAMLALLKWLVNLRRCRWFVWADLVIVLLLALALIDFRLSQITGVRLDWDVLTLANSPKMAWRMARPHLPALIALLSASALVYAVCVRLLRRWPAVLWNPAAGSGRGGMRFVLVLAPLLAMVGLYRVAEDRVRGLVAFRLITSSPVFAMAVHDRIPPPEFAAMARELRLFPSRTAPPLPPGAKPRDVNVVLVLMESSYNEHLSLFGAQEETQPLLSRYRDRMELFPNIFSDFASSIHARFALFTGLYPTRRFQNFTLKRVPVKSLFEVLQSSGYHCSVFYSSFLDYTGFRNFLSHRQIDELYDADTMPGTRETAPVSWGLQEEETLRAMQARIREYAETGERFFLSYIPAAPHYPYDSIPARFRRYHVKELHDYTPLFWNELLYMDWVLANLLETLEAHHLLERTLVILTNDHGEMLGAKGGPIGHGWSVEPELANTPLMIMDPARPGALLNDATGSLIDLLPTILDRLRIPIPPSELYQGRSLYDEQTQGARTIYLNSYRQSAMVKDSMFLWQEFVSESTTQEAVARRLYRIANDGPRTLFIEQPVPPGLFVPITQFNRFQEILLEGYEFYREELSRSDLSVQPFPLEELDR